MEIIKEASSSNIIVNCSYDSDYGVTCSRDR